MAKGTKETMETVAFRALARQCRWMRAEARRRKVDRSELLRMLLDKWIEEDRLERERARRMKGAPVEQLARVLGMQWQGVGRRPGPERVAPESAERAGVDRE